MRGSNGWRGDDAMNAWPFIIAAYGIAALGTLGLTLWSLIAMRAAERAVEDMRER